MTASPLCESRLPVGSSASRISGSPATARATQRVAAGPGELAGQMLRAVRHADPLEAPPRRAAALGGLHASVGQRQLDVLEDRQIANQVETLEDEPESRLRTRARSEAGSSATGPVVQQVRPFGRRVEQAENGQQR